MACSVGGMIGAARAGRTAKPITITEVRRMIIQMKGNKKVKEWKVSGREQTRERRTGFKIWGIVRSSLPYDVLILLKMADTN